MISIRVMKLLGLLLLLNLCARCVAHSDLEGDVETHVAALSQAISGMALNATANYLSMYAPAPRL
jgi:hypothetical protein